jgi:hypothetical protein
MTLEVLGEAATTADPGKSAFDDPSFGENDEAMQLVALDDLQRPVPGLCDNRGHLRSLIAGVGEDPFDEGEQAARASIEDQPGAIAILQIGGVDDHV